MVLGQVFLGFLVRHEVGDPLEQEIEVVRAEQRLVVGAVGAPGRDGREDLAKRRRQLRAAVVVVAAGPPVSDVVDHGGDVPVELSAVRRDVTAGTEQTRLLAGEEHEANRPLRPRSGGEHARHLHD